MTKNIGLVFSLVTIYTSLSLGYNQSEFSKFAESLPLGGADVQEQFNLFKSGNLGLPEAYPQEFLKTMRAKVLSESSHALEQLDKSCVERVKVDFPESISPDRSAFRKNMAVQDFESGIIRIEVSACFKKSNPIQIMRTFADPKFQKESISTIVSSVQKGRLVCDNTDVFSIGKSSYCYEPTISETPSLVLNHHYNVWNAPLAEAPIPVYYRELLVTVHSADHETVLHMVAYVRSVKLGSFKKIFAKSSIQNEQAKSMDLLRNL